MTDITPSEEKHISRSKLLLWISAILIILVLLWVVYWLFYLRYHETTDDAYANGYLINVQSAIPGSVVAFFADDTDLVQEGQLIVLLDSTDYQVAYDRELCALASVVLQVRQLYNTVGVNQSNVETKRIAEAKARFDFENRQRLVNTQAISQEDFIHARDALSTAKSSLELAENQLKVSQDAVGNTPIEQHPLIKQQKERVRQAFYHLKHCSIYAPTTGYVAKRAVNVGSSVTMASNLMAIIPTSPMWIDANFKETQLTYMRIGQPTTVWLDIYGSRAPFKGQVLGIGSGTGSVFSIIPPQNATGNWIKIVQRLPVRISLDPQTLKQYPSRVGLSAYVDVDITRQDLPMLAPMPSTKPVASTKVFALDMAEVDAKMESIIQNNLKNSS